MPMIDKHALPLALKIAVEIAYFGLAGVTAAVGVALFLSLVAPAVVNQALAPAIQAGHWPASGGSLPLLAAGISSAGLAAVAGLLRRLLHTLVIGDPFAPRNVVRLRLIGAVLAGLELFSYGFRALGLGASTGVGAVTAWFAVLMALVLAELFAEGARLRAESDLTV